MKKKVISIVTMNIPTITERIPMDVSMIEELPRAYPEEFMEFCSTHKLKPPKINTGNGMALSAMLIYNNTYS